MGNRKQEFYSLFNSHVIKYFPDDDLMLAALSLIESIVYNKASKIL